MKKYSEDLLKNAGKVILTLFCLLTFTALLNGQTDKQYIRQGNRNYNKNNYSGSEILYRKAIDRNENTSDAIFNIGDALYKQEKYEDAGKQFLEHLNRSEDRTKKSTSLYNLGNSLLMADKVKESIDAYKGSLKMNPDNMEAKYNLAYAQDLLKQQQEQQQQQQQQQDQNQDQDKNDQKEQDKDQEGDDEQKQNSPQDNQQKDQKEGQQGNISKEDAERLLNALANDEKKVQEKVKLAKAAGSKSRTLKNW